MILYTNSVPRTETFWELYTTTGWNREYQITPDQLYGALLESRYMVSAYDDDRLVGFGRVISDGVLHALIVDLIVLPEYQRQGIGASLLSKLVSHCRGQGVRDIQLYSAKGQAGFYEKQGFSPRPDDAPGMEYKHAE
ncbi:MAG: GNAT family N-acetyltransferase [Anaerolineae bacterium]